eukprot:NODE_759_length_4134_cov_0.728129.p1 type:complete len:808 gc:universal NODE_759_length_4134_cov_0.728129:3397-974(-)
MVKRNASKSNEKVDLGSNKEMKQPNSSDEDIGYLQLNMNSDEGSTKDSTIDESSPDKVESAPKSNDTTPKKGVNKLESANSSSTEFFDAEENIIVAIPERVRNNSISPNSSVSNTFIQTVLSTPTSSKNASSNAIEILSNTAEQFSSMELIGYASLVCILLNEISVNLSKKKEENSYMFWSQQTKENLAFESSDHWATKIRSKLFKHLNIGPEERQMIKAMSSHDVMAIDIAESIIPQDIKDKIAWERDFNYNKMKIAMMEDSCLDIEKELAEESKKEENYYRHVDSQEELQTPPSPQSLESPTESSIVPEILYKPSERKDLSNITKYIEPDATDIRHTMLTDLFLALISDYSYDARSRALLFRLSRLLSVPRSDVLWIERVVAEKLRYIAELDDNKEYSKQDLEARENKDKKRRYIAIGLASVAGGITIGVSGGLAAPLLAVGLAKIGLTGGGAFLGSTAGGLAVGGSTGIVGSIMGANGMAKRTKNITQFEFYTVLHERQVSLTISVGGWLSAGDREDSDIALPFFPLAPEEGDHVSIMWESNMLRELGSIFKILASEVISSTVQQALALTMMSSFVAFLSWPIALSKLGYLIDNPWSNALDRAQKAGYILADKLIRQFQDGRPISLVGYSLGARVIYFCLEELQRNHAYGIVENVFLAGCPVTASKSQWESITSVVSGRFVNGYARNDWILGYLFRATSGGLFSVAGLGGVNQAGIENVDLSDIVDGHMLYRVNMPRILKRFGLNVLNDQLSLVYKKDKQFRERKDSSNDEEIQLDERIKNISNQAAKNEAELENELSEANKKE